MSEDDTQSQVFNIPVSPPRLRIIPNPPDMHPDEAVNFELEADEYRAHHARQLIEQRMLRAHEMELLAMQDSYDEYIEESSMAEAMEIDNDDRLPESPKRQLTPLSDDSRAETPVPYVAPRPPRLLTARPPSYIGE
jgi:hypothetical protein